MSENDSISFISDFMFDTGSPYDIVFSSGSSYTQANIVRFLQDKSSWYEYKMQYNSGVIYNPKYYIKDNYMINDTINIMVQRTPGITTDIIRMGIIARFNWYILNAIYQIISKFAPHLHKKRIQPEFTPACGYAFL